MTEHKHAHFLRALADGVPLEEFEGQYTSWPPDEWHSVPFLSPVTNPEEWQVRRKQKTHVVNGFTVPAPETEMPAVGVRFWYVNLASDLWCHRYAWSGCEGDRRMLERGLVHLNAAAAVANAKAMCGIDPNAKEES